MGLELNTQGVKTFDEVGGNKPLPGRYHMIVKHVDESMSKEKLKDKIVIEFEVLSGTTPGQAKKTIAEFFNVTNEWAKEKLTRYAMVMGLIGGNEKKEVKFESTFGRQLIVEIVDVEEKAATGTKTGRTFRNISREGFWPIGHADVNDVPLEPTMLKMHQAGTVPAMAARGTNGAPAQTAPIGGQAGGDSGSHHMEAVPAGAVAGAGVADDAWENL